MSKEKNKRNLTTFISFIGLIICLAALIYPVVSDKWNSYRDAQVAQKYHNEVLKNPEKFEKEYRRAKEYNKELKKQGRNIVTDAEFQPDAEYEKYLNINGDGMMGYIEIPAIGITEPILHYTDDVELAKGIGHIHGSSLPVGGDTTHCVLTGHRGLPNQKFFTDLDKVKVGDKFYLHVLGHTLAYKIDNIRTVLPTEVSSLMLEDGKDLCTLVTCTPYGVNTHRLLVTGHRVKFDETKVDDTGHVTTETHKTIIDPAMYVFAGFIIFIVFFTILSVISKLKNKKAKKKAEKAEEDEEEKNK